MTVLSRVVDKTDECTLMSEEHVDRSERPKKEEKDPKEVIEEDDGGRR